VIQVDMGGHPPILTYSKEYLGNLLFLAVFQFLNFWGHFEGLNEVFFAKTLFEPQKWISSSIPFQWAIVHPKWRSSAKVTPLGSWYTKYTKLPKMESRKLLAFHLSGLGFWIFFMLKRHLEPHCNDHLLVNVSSRHISSQK